MAETDPAMVLQDVNLVAGYGATHLKKERNKKMCLLQVVLDKHF